MFRSIFYKTRTILINNKCYSWWEKWTWKRPLYAHLPTCNVRRLCQSNPDNAKSACMYDRRESVGCRQADHVQ